MIVELSSIGGKSQKSQESANTATSLSPTSTREKYFAAKNAPIHRGIKIASLQTVSILH